MKRYQVVIFEVLFCMLIIGLVSCGGNQSASRSGEDDDTVDDDFIDDDAIDDDTSDDDSSDDDSLDDDIVDDDTIDDDTADDDTTDDDTSDDDTGPDDWSTQTGDSHQFNVELDWADYPDNGTLYALFWYGTNIQGPPSANGMITLLGVGPSNIRSAYAPIIEGQTVVSIVGVWILPGKTIFDPNPIGAAGEPPNNPYSIEGSGPTDVAITLEPADMSCYTLFCF